MPEVWPGLIVSLVVAGVAYWRGALSGSGTAAAVVVGTLIFSLGGPLWALLLGIFFVTSSALSRFRDGEKRLTAEEFQKGDRRDAGQVLANGGLGALLAALNGSFPAPIWFPLYVGAMAGVTADTWATELGTLSSVPPRLITTGRAVAAGASGAISAAGIVASLLGGLLIGLAAGLLSETLSVAAGAAIGGLAGLSGSLFDSLLGATVQQQYHCDRCAKQTERPVHTCGERTRPSRGWPWLNNDAVNLLASMVAGAFAGGLWAALPGLG
jgi:uncharacterized protein (TIGR00297 family)